MGLKNFEDFSQYIVKKSTEKTPFISIIIPVYNRADKIKFCLNKLLESKYSKEYFELIIIDDCSTDNSFEVIKSFFDLFPNILIMKRRINSGGASAPRNDAMNLSSGEYLLFLDSDDYLTPNALMDAVNLISNDLTIDMVCMPFFKNQNSSRKISSSAFFYKNDITNLKFKDTKLFNSLNAVGKLFRAATIKNYEINFPINIKVREDNWFMMKAYSISNNIAILGNSKKYYFTCDTDEISLSKNGTPPRDAVKIYLSAYDFIINNNSIISEDKIDLLSIFLNRYTPLIKRGEHAPIKLLNHTKNELKQIIVNKYTSTETKEFITSLLKSNQVILSNKF
ncbi:glycosyltransferase family 2 protein [Acinetobacter nosocomialis]|uniref:glycosyltransferase family 2 protein n=1 Tax=Acinetobacter TaxID=469 RepID=UPI0023421624|nr:MULTISPECIES: glycosyltransferase family 2 protein [unclassified Acinetobacter]MDC5002156.1 glycosyltransferase [Acinetobacter baumannii]MEB3797140.1 glycosyltransferase [Acinetobacter sp. IK24]MEB3816268.1 glycosyltransferase [Acinetobacter sp. IK22]MEB3835504.1 glycosyltransferase [Acinetobacter sp. IK23]